MAIVTCATGVAAAATETVVHDFISLRNGANPQAGLTVDAGGNLYGTTENGGTHGYGVVFKLTVSANGNWTQRVLYNFTGGADGGYPHSGVTLDAAGNVYGTTYQGGNLTCSSYFPGCGVVFELTTQGNGNWTERVLHAFNGGSDGSKPVGGLTLDAAGNLYGTTSYGGKASCLCGTVFKLTLRGGAWWKSVIHFFNSINGADPESSLIFDSHGNLYGTTFAGGSSTGNCVFSGGCGTVYEISHTSSGRWTESVLHDFGSGSDSEQPISNLIFDRAGNLYGSTEGYGGVGTTIYELSPTQGAWTENILYSFPEGAGEAIGGLAFDAAGNLYGVNPVDGRNFGSVFELSPTSLGNWILTTLYVFLGSTDGGYPEAGLVADPRGDLYGTTYQGGDVGAGAVFEMKPTSNGHWNERTIYRFPSVDGAAPGSALISDGSGNFYGTTPFGGNSSCVYSYPLAGCGMVFELSRKSGGGWTRSILYSFKGGNDGQAPEGNLVFDHAGNLYGGASGGNLGAGVIFELTPGSDGKWTRNVLYNFQGTTDGWSPSGGLVFDSAGNLYGVAAGGGAYGYGTVFELSPTSSGWIESTLYGFTGNSDGGLPSGSLVFDSTGNIYGTTEQGGVQQGYYGVGTVFELTHGSSGWTETTLHIFQLSGDGYIPLAGLILDKAGNLYGTTVAGGDLSCFALNYAGCGTVFELSPTFSGSWTETILYTFTGNNTGMGAAGGVILDQAGNLYGTTQAGAIGNCSTSYYSAPCGGVYELTPPSGGGGSWTETVLYGFTGGLDGGAPSAGLTFDSDGHLFGTTSMGGAVGNGVVFEIAP